MRLFPKRLMALTVAACFAFGAQMACAEKTAGQVIDDSTIASSTKAALAGVDLAAAGAINVEVYKGTVQLAGFVHATGDRDKAIAAAKGVTGVKQVLDAMVVAEGDRTVGQTLDDTTIQTRLKATLADTLGVEPALAINTGVRKGEVILSGFVTDAAIRSRAGDLARNISGVTKVHNEIAVEP